MTIDHQSDYVDDLLDRLESAAADAGELSLSTMSAEQQNRWLTAMFDMDAQVDGLKFTAIQEAEASAMSVTFGNRILTTHLAKQTHQPAQTLGADRSLALWLNDFPTLHTALTAGVLSRAHVVELKSIDCHDIHHLMIRDQELFIDTQYQNTDPPTSPTAK